MDVEHGSFMLLVLNFATTGEMGKECIRYYSQLAELVAAKKGEHTCNQFPGFKQGHPLLSFRSALVCLQVSRVKRHTYYANDQNKNYCDIEIATATGAIDIV